MGKWIVKLFIGKVEVKGKMPKGQYIIASNHPRELDAWVLDYVFPHLRIMAADSVMGWFGVILPRGCFTAKNGIQNALDLINQGHSIGICPSGWTELTGNELPWKTGVVVIADKAKLPIYLVKLEYAALRGGWVNKFPSVIQWAIDLVIPRKRGITVHISQLPFELGSAILETRKQYQVVAEYLKNENSRM